MPLTDLMRDNVELLKSNGEKITNLRASVQRDRVYMNAGKVIVEPGDIIRRKLSTGAEETYRVTDPGFQEGLHGIPPHYQMYVQKLGVPEATKAIQNVTYNIHGHHAHINNSSVDQSSNVLYGDSDFAKHLSDLRAAVNGSTVAAEDKEQATEVLDEVEKELKSTKPRKSIVTALLKSLPQIAGVTSAAAAVIRLVHELKN